MYMIKVLLADDQELIRESRGFVLGAQSDITVVGMAKNGREAIELVRSEKPDVVLMDIRMPEVDGVECTRLIKSAHPNIKVIVLTTFDDDEYVFNALRFGASGYLLKGVSVADLTNAVREVVRGGSIIAPDVASKALQMFARMAKDNLTIGVDEKQTEELQDNEWRIIREVGAGLSNQEIAAALCLSEGTVRNYLSSILSKLELRDRTQLAIWAVQTGVAVRSEVRSEAAGETPDGGDAAHGGVPDRDGVQPHEAGRAAARLYGGQLLGCAERELLRRDRCGHRAVRAGAPERTRCLYERYPQAGLLGVAHRPVSARQ